MGRGGQESRLKRSKRVYCDRLKRGVCVACGRKKRRKQTDCRKCFLKNRKYQKTKGKLRLKPKRNNLLR